jgi:hypothetical protein
MSDATRAAQPRRRLARGLEDISHLFLPPAPPAARSPGEGGSEPPRDVLPGAAAASAPPSAGAVSPRSDRRLRALVCKHVGSLEDGLRVADVNLPLDVGGPVDLVAVDRRNRIVIVDVEPARSDDLLLRGLCHLDWFARNVPIVVRMYSGYGIDFLSEPRVFLLAPLFSPAVLGAARRVASLGIACFTYETMSLPAGVVMIFNRP